MSAHAPHLRTAPRNPKNIVVSTPALEASKRAREEHEAKAKAEAQVKAAQAKAEGAATVEGAVMGQGSGTPGLDTISERDRLASRPKMAETIAEGASNAVAGAIFGVFGRLPLPVRAALAAALAGGALWVGTSLDGPGAPVDPKAGVVVARAPSGQRIENAYGEAIADRTGRAGLARWAREHPEGLQGADPKDPLEPLRAISGLPLPTYSKDAMLAEAVQGRTAFRIVSVRTGHAAKAPVVVTLGTYSFQAVLGVEPLLLPVPVGGARVFGLDAMEDGATDVVVSGAGALQFEIDAKHPVRFTIR